jgi:hypothetical protein
MDSKTIAIILCVALAALPPTRAQDIISTCTDNKYFDTTSLKCQPCNSEGLHMEPDTNRRTCICQRGYKLNQETNNCDACPAVSDFSV